MKPCWAGGVKESDNDIINIIVYMLRPDAEYNVLFTGTINNDQDHCSERVFVASQVRGWILILWCSLCEKLDDGSASLMRSRHLISNTGLTVTALPWANHQGFYRLTKTHSHSSLSCGKHPNHHWTQGPVTTILLKLQNKHELSIVNIVGYTVNYTPKLINCLNIHRKNIFAALVLRLV